VSDESETHPIKLRKVKIPIIMGPLLGGKKGEEKTESGKLKAEGKNCCY
jgi:hypothetical protein